MLRQTPNRRHRLLAPANADLESSYESRPGYHPVEVHTQAGPTQVSLHNQAVEALVTGTRCRCHRLFWHGRTSFSIVSPSRSTLPMGRKCTPPEVWLKTAPTSNPESRRILPRERWPNPKTSNFR